MCRNILTSKIQGHQGETIVQKCCYIKNINTMKPSRGADNTSGKYFFFQIQGLTTDKEHSCILDVECICLSASSTDMKYEYIKHDGFSGYKVLTWQRFPTGFAL